MLRRAFRGLWTIFGLWLSVVGCDSGSRTSVAGPQGGNAATGGTFAIGGSAVAPATTCSMSSECTDQVCSADGRCVDCSQDQDCLSGQHCEQERCIANGGDRGGSSSGGSGGSPSGGSSGTSSCNGAQLVFVIQRSGAMFEQPSEEESYWSMVQSAVTADDGALAGYAGRLEVGALFFVRLQYDEDMACPVVSSAAPASAGLVPLRELFDTNHAAYESLADENAKMDAPVAEAVTAAANAFTGTNKHLVLITTGVPDTCQSADTTCTVDATIKAVQSAAQQGVTTHVIGLGNTDSLDAADDDDGYLTYLTQLANAGANEAVKMSAAYDEDCGDDDATATYAESSGDAQAFRAESAADLKTAVSAILQRVCP